MSSGRLAQMAAKKKAKKVAKKKTAKSLLKSALNRPARYRAAKTILKNRMVFVYNVYFNTPMY